MHDGIFGVLNGLVEIPKTEVGFKEERLKLIEITVKNTADLGPVIRLMPIAYSPASYVRVCLINQIKSINQSNRKNKRLKKKKEVYMQDEIAIPCAWEIFQDVVG